VQRSFAHAADEGGAVSYLLDTNVVSELRKPARRAARPVREWAARQVTHELSISVVTVMEIEIGVARMERRDTAQGRILRNWFEQDLLAAFADRMLPITLDVVRRAAHLHVPDPRPERDVLIAATALTRGLTVATRNTADFELLGVPLLNPWDE
jgi:predicted nucleic acid-binding protein